MKRNGFTLVEVLVILAILAALAAILVPTVANQVRKSDVSRAVGDLNNLRTGIEAFLVNVHRYPGDAEDLSTAIIANGTDTDVNGANYSSGLAAQWEGPYIDRIFSEADSMATGFGAFIDDDFEVVAGDNGENYLTVVILEIAAPEFYSIDEVLDGDTVAAAGRFRHSGDTARFLALPIN